MILFPLISRPCATRSFKSSRSKRSQLIKTTRPKVGLEEPKGLPTNTGRHHMADTEVVPKAERKEATAEAAEEEIAPEDAPQDHRQRAQMR